MINAPRFFDFAPSPALLGMVDMTRDTQQRHPMAGPTDAEKYRWIRANRGNFAIVDALGKSDRDVDFDARIADEMSMCAAGLRSYRFGASHL